ncbi:MAG: hypothetical protein ACREJB_02785, partial [Planctomycetaceae bacterium]
GATGTYRVVGFAAVRVVAVEGSGGSKFFRIQPTILIDETAIPGEAGEGQSDYVYGPLKLVRQASRGKRRPTRCLRLSAGQRVAPRRR